MEPQTKLEEIGLKKEKILETIADYRKNDVDWEHGRAFAYVYHYSEELKAMLKEINNLFFSTNALNPAAFPSLKQFEAETVAMIGAMLGGDHKVVGNITTGGTESICLAVKAYRDWAKKKFPNIKHPEMILPESVHPAFNKAGHYFDVHQVYVPLDENYRPQLKAVEAALSDNTILIVGSACDFPIGGVDPITELAAIAKERNIGFHTDSCVGGFILPFLKKLGYEIPNFDFSVPGVTSISIDIHKYGHGPKGTSAILFKSDKIWKHQFYAYTNWTGGLYASPTILGTRSGGPIAGAWATLKYMGEKGYLDAARITKTTTERLIQEIKNIPELKILGNPVMTVFSFTSTDPELNIYAVGDVLMEKGWFLDKMQKPQALHCLVNPIHAHYVDEFISALKQAISEVKENPSKSNQGEAAMYGMMATFKEKDKLEDVIVGYLADQYKIKGGKR